VIRLPPAQPRVGDIDIHRTMRRLGLRDHIANRGLVRHIAAHGDAADLVHDGLRGLQIAVGHTNLGPCRSRVSGQRRPDPAAPARDHNGRILKFQTA